MPDIFCLNISRPLRLINCEPILPELLAFLGRWPFRMEASRGEEAAVITLTGLDNGRYALQSPWLEGERQARPGILETANLTKILCGLAVDLAQACLGESDIFGLHGAAAERAGRLLIFPNRNRAGKSLLAGALMADGFRVYGDDLIGLTGDGQGRSFGFPLRLRLPWPELPPRTERFFQARLAWADRHYCFIRGQGREQAAFGQQCPIGAVIVLERQRRPGPAELLPLRPDQGLQALADRYLLRPGQAGLSSEA